MQTAPTKAHEVWELFLRQQKQAFRELTHVDLGFHPVFLRAKWREIQDTEDCAAWQLEWMVQCLYRQNLVDEAADCGVKLLSLPVEQWDGCGLFQRLLRALGEEQAKDIASKRNKKRLRAALQDMYNRSWAAFKRIEPSDSDYSEDEDEYEAQWTRERKSQERLDPVAVAQYLATGRATQRAQIVRIQHTLYYADAVYYRYYHRPLFSEPPGWSAGDGPVYLSVLNWNQQTQTKRRRSSDASYEPPVQERTESSARAWEIIDTVRDVLRSLSEPQLKEIAAAETPYHCQGNTQSWASLEVDHLLGLYDNDFPSPGAVFVFSELEKRDLLRPVWEC